MSELPYKPENLTILVADGHDSTRKGIVRVLAKMGFKTIVEVHDGAEALKVLDEQSADLVICDVNLRKKTGFDVLRSLRQSELSSDIPVVIVTGESSRDDIVKAADQGASDYILKPFQPVDLEKKISSVLDSYFAPEPLTQMVRAAEKLVINKRYDEALKLLEAALVGNETSVRARHGKALVLDRVGRVDDAVKLLRENIAINPNFYKTYAVLADISLRRDKPAEAIDYMRKELELNGKNPDRQVQLGRMLLDNGEIEAAMHHLREALKESPKHRGALFVMGQAYAMDSNLDKAIYYFRRLRRHHPDNTRALEAMVRYAMEADDPRKAELALRDERTAHPEKMDVHIVLTRLYAATERNEQAIETIDKALLAMPENIDGLCIKAALHARMKDYEPAIATYTAVLKKQTSIEIFLRLTEIYLAMSKPEDAIDTVHKALSLKEELGKLYQFLGDAYVQAGQHAKAYLVYHRSQHQGHMTPELKQNQQAAHQAIFERRQGRSPRKIAS